MDYFSQTDVRLKLICASKSNLEIEIERIHCIFKIDLIILKNKYQYICSVARS